MVYNNACIILVFYCFLFLCEHFGSEISRSLSIYQSFSSYLSLRKFSYLCSCENGIFTALPYNHRMYVDSNILISPLTILGGVY